MSTYKLYYFNVRGRAEIARLIFSAAGEKFEDIRYERNEWLSYKSEMPLGQMPVLEVDGVKLPQSMTIARFLAKQFGLAGKDNLEQAKVDVVVDTSIDLAVKLLPILYEPDEGKKQIEMNSSSLTNCRNFEVLSKLYSNEGPFFVENHLTWADLEVYDMLEYILRIDSNILQSYSWLQHNRQEVEKQPKIAAYLKNRPSPSF